MFRRSVLATGAGAFAAILLAAAILQASAGLVIGDREASALRGAGCGTCDIYASCQQCTGSNSNFTMCSSGGTTYIECQDTSNNTTCGTCTAWASDCGDYLHCTAATGCSNCVNQGACSGCTTVRNPSNC